MVALLHSWVRPLHVASFVVAPLPNADDHLLFRFFLTIILLLLLLAYSPPPVICLVLDILHPFSASASSSFVSSLVVSSFISSLVSSFNYSLLSSSSSSPSSSSSCSLLSSFFSSGYVSTIPSLLMVLDLISLEMACADGKSGYSKKTANENCEANRKETHGNFRCHPFNRTFIPKEIQLYFSRISNSCFLLYLSR